MQHDTNFLIYYRAAISSHLFLRILLFLYVSVRVPEVLLYSVLASK